jgi:hypothetical protein
MYTLVRCRTEQNRSTLWTNCSTLLMEMSSKSPGFRKCWSGCLNLKVANASQSEKNMLVCIHHTQNCQPASVWIQICLSDGALLLTLSLLLAGVYPDRIILQLAEGLLRKPVAWGVTMCRTLKVKAAGSFQMLVAIYQVTWYHIP